MFFFFSLSFFWIKMALFRNTIMQRKFGSTKLLCFTVLKEELLKRILLSGFKLGRHIAMILYKARTHKFQIASRPYPYQCFRCGYEILRKCQGYIPPPSSVMFMYAYCYICVFLLCMFCSVYPVFIEPAGILRLH